MSGPVPPPGALSGPYSAYGGPPGAGMPGFPQSYMPGPGMMPPMMPGVFPGYPGHPMPGAMPPMMPPMMHPGMMPPRPGMPGMPVPPMQSQVIMGKHLSHTYSLNNIFGRSSGLMNLILYLRDIEYQP
jgi:hypothetical protein